MALLKALCWALIFIIRIRFPPGTSLAVVFHEHVVYDGELGLFPHQTLVDAGSCHVGQWWRWWWWRWRGGW